MYTHTLHDYILIVMPSFNTCHMQIEGAYGMRGAFCIIGNYMIPCRALHVIQGNASHGQVHFKMFRCPNIFIIPLNGSLHIYTRWYCSTFITG